MRPGILHKFVNYVRIYSSFSSLSEKKFTIYGSFCPLFFTSTELNVIQVFLIQMFERFMDETYSVTLVSLVSRDPRLCYPNTTDV